MFSGLSTRALLVLIAVLLVAIAVLAVPVWRDLNRCDHREMARCRHDPHCVVVQDC
jgi:hypothetical protein